MKNTKPYALVTAGGTTVPLDGVRFITNGSEGDFGVAIANALVDAGAPVVLVLSRVGCLKHKDRILREGVEVVPFTTFDDYVAAIHRVVRLHGPPAYAFSAAAVSDYGPAEVALGKIRSDADELALRLVRLPKVLSTWRELFGPASKIVGFKLLSRNSSTEADLFTAAWAQNTEAGLDCTVANFKEDIGDGKHTAWLVTEEGKICHVSGERPRVARVVVEYALGDRASHLLSSEHWIQAVDSATIRLRARSTDRVLLLERATRSFHGFWANPGGRRESDDASDWHAAVRELLEETGIDLGFLADPPAKGIVTFTHTRVGDEERIYRVVCFPVDIDEEKGVSVPRSEVSGCRWFSGAEARERPMGPATRSVLTETWPAFSS